MLPIVGETPVAPAAGEISRADASAIAGPPGQPGQNGVFVEPPPEQPASNKARAPTTADVFIVPIGLTRLPRGTCQVIGQLQPPYGRDRDSAAPPRARRRRARANDRRRRAGSR